MGVDYYDITNLHIYSRDKEEWDSECIEVLRVGRYFSFYYDDDKDDDIVPGEDEREALPDDKPDKLIWKDGTFYVKNEAKYAKYITEDTVRIVKTYYSKYR